MTTPGTIPRPRHRRLQGSLRLTTLGQQGFSLRDLRGLQDNLTHHGVPDSAQITEIHHSFLPGRPPVIMIRWEMDHPLYPQAAPRIPQAAPRGPMTA